MMNTLFEKFPFLNYVIWGNTLGNYLLSFIIFLALILVLKIIKTVIIVRLKKLVQKTKTTIDDKVVEALDSIHWPFYVFVALHFSLQFLNLSDKITRYSNYVLMLAVVYYLIQFITSMINYGTVQIIKKKETEKQSVGIIRLMSVLIKIFIWVSAFLLVVSNMGFNVTSLIAGLGIGGIAIGLALQSILGDLFSSLAIYFDKPFKVGDFVIIDQHMGTVKNVGVKTTRLEALQGEEIVMSNSDLTNSRIQNFGVMKRRRIVFQFGVTYDTPADKLEQIPVWIKTIIKDSKFTEFDRSHFKEFADSSLAFENVYYINTGDYTEYMNTQQEINLAIVRKFATEGVEMAFPTRTLHIKNESK